MSIFNFTVDRTVDQSADQTATCPLHEAIEPSQPPSRFRHRWIQLFSVCCAIGVGLLPLMKPKPVLSAEQVSVTYGPFEFPLSIESLETFAETGEITGGMRFYARFLDDVALAEFQQFLQRRFEVNPFVLSQLTYSPLGEDVVRRLGDVIRTDANLNGFYALRSAMILAANDPEGLSVLGVLRQYPSYRIRISAQQLFQLRRELTKQIEYRDAAIAAIEEVATLEAANRSAIDLPALPVPGEPGPYAVTMQSLILNRDRQTLLGETIERRFRVLVYLPNGLTEPAPVVVISHGLGSTPEAFAYLGEHLATHGFVTVLPQHIGSDESRREGALTGVFSSVVTPVEFVDRPFDISYTLDELERLNETDARFQGRMNLEQVGVIGHSFGGYTALALAGANLKTQAYLRQQCETLSARLDASFVLQCTAASLPPFTFALQDERIKATIAVSPLTSLVFGPEGMGQIQTPTMIVAGSNDFIASAVQEQIHPFLWLDMSEKYLAVMVPSSHTFVDRTPPGSNPTLDAISTLLSGPAPELGQAYVRELSTAFMQTYLGNQPEYEAFLTAAYARSIEQEPLQLELIRSLTPEQLEQAFGGPPPIPFFPDMATAGASPDRSDQSGATLQTIAETGVLRAAIRVDSPPFGFVDANDQIRGYCVTLLTGLTDRLQQQLGTPVRLDISTESTRENRFAIVQDGTVQIECGPNRLRPDLEDVRFSTPFFLTGTQFLVRTTETEQINPLSNLANVRVGVVDETTAAFVRQRYPRATLVPFAENSTITTGVQALVDGTIDAMAADGILLLNAADRANLSTNDYTLLPRGPLTCAPYSLILPEDDAQWQETVDDFLVGQAGRDIRRQQFANLSSYLFLTLDYCVE
ncbi:alpha/beta fold hydrolase [Thermocoleostomius sinensis]|uniref:Alpha/beta fold hydrolase n=1 Tax=Thermocoleostomius sinensis A174 TaxID=2016057 RepID=A0A9E9C5E4_9CYAN|nr:alpha/beta fold hydrolase [Thermocoleostomius sinensis]WAL61036.1 alpha/beta fold hydrolase [Thermocoleostomius sinensis A174]